MGRMRFVVPRRERLSDDALRRVYLCGLEGVPWRGLNRWTDHSPAEGQGEFSVEREVDESGNLFVPWSLAEHGELTLSTASLMEREAPYNLTVELARGLVNRLRNQAADWSLSGLKLSAAFHQPLRLASQTLMQGVTGPGSNVRAADLAEAALAHGMQALEVLTRDYVHQATAVRHEQTGALATLLAARLGARPLVRPEEKGVVQALNAASLDFSWRDVEPSAGRYEWAAFDEQMRWSRNLGLRILGGPLLQLDRRHLPDWIYLWEDDLEQIQACVSQYISSVVQRYQGKVQIWNCAAGMNVAGALSLTEEQKLRLVVSAIEAVRRADPNTPLMVTFDQPWGEYLAREDSDLAPWQFADSLVRAELGVAAVGLEINMGYWPGGTLPRDTLEFSSLLDRWSLLGLPLFVFLRVPNSAAPPAEKVPASVRLPLPDYAACRGLADQRRQVEGLVRMILAKHFVQGMVWNELADVDTREFPHSGLFDDKHRSKPVVQTLTRIRKKHLV